MAAICEALTVRGRLEAFFETGTEGIIWSLHDSSLPAYDGLWPLYDGDQLQVIDGDGWQGVVNLEYHRNHQESPYGGIGGQVASGFWVHGFQDDLDPDVWAKMFFDGYRAILTPGPTSHQLAREPHVFRGSSAGMEARLRGLADKSAQELFRSTIYSWLIFYSDGQWYSPAKDWDFSLDDTLRLIGSPSAEQITQWRTYPKTYNDTLMPFDWTTFARLALLYGVRGGLDWKFNTKQERADWLSDKKELLFQPELDGIMQVRDLALVGITEWC